METGLNLDDLVAGVHTGTINAGVALGDTTGVITTEDHVETDTYVNWAAQYLSRPFTYTVDIGDASGIVAGAIDAASNVEVIADEPIYYGSGYLRDHIDGLLSRLNNTPIQVVCDPPNVSVDTYHESELDPECKELDNFLSEFKRTAG